MFAADVIYSNRWSVGSPQLTLIVWIWFLAIKCFKKVVAVMY